MKKHRLLTTGLITLLLICSLLFTACTDAKTEDNSTDDTAPVMKSSTPDSAASVTETNKQDNTEPITETKTSDTPAYDPYATENRYDIPASMFERQSGVDYGTLDKDVTYYSTVAGDNKQVNVLMPAGYDKTKTYPVLYVVHGFDADHNSHIGENTYLTLLYGNMLHEDLTVPMILVGIDMYTDKLADKEDKTYEELRYIYDKVVEEIHADLMPFIESHYPVSTERRDTAVGGVSEGGAKSLCIGFSWLDEFGWIGSFAPDGNVIPIREDVPSFWYDPFMQEFPQPTEDNTPYYIYMAVGSEDPWNIRGTLFYRDTLNDMGVKNQTDYVDGYGHDSDFWGQCYYNYLHKLFRT